MASQYATCKKVLEVYFKEFPTNTTRIYARLAEKELGSKKKPQVQQSDKRKFSDFVYLSQEEYNKLCEEIGEVNTKKCIQALNDYIGSRGVQYKSHFYTIKARAKKDNLSKPKPKIEAQQEIINEMTPEQKEEIKAKMIRLRSSFSMPAL